MNNFRLGTAAGINQVLFPWCIIVRLHTCETPLSLVPWGNPTQGCVGFPLQDECIPAQIR